MPPQNETLGAGPVGCLGYDHVRFVVGNAKQAAHYFCAVFGFEPLAYRGLETGDRQVVCHVVKQGKIVFAFESALRPDNEDYSQFHARHGDAVRDVVFEVDDLVAMLPRIRRSNAVIVKDVTEENDDFGSVKYITLKVFGDVRHTLLERKNYRGLFMPGYVQHPMRAEVLTKMPKTLLNHIDHCVGSQPIGGMDPVGDWYENVLGFKRIQNEEENLIYTEFSGLKYLIARNASDNIRMTINEPVPSKRKAKSQIQEFIDFNGDAGVQHFGFDTKDIIASLAALKQRGLEFLQPPAEYYKNLKHRLANSPVKVLEDLSVLEKHGVLIDFDDRGYLLQIFAKPCQDRPTIFIEIIQRRNHDGFGAGNVKSLFQAMEQEQMKRHNFYYED